MGAISTDKQRLSLSNDDTASYAVAASEKIPAGALVSLNSSGYAINAVTTAGTKVVGVAHDGFDNSAGAAGDLTGTNKQRHVTVESGRPFLFAVAGSPIPGAPVYVVDNDNLTTVAGNVLAGVCVQADVDGGSGLWYVLIEGIEAEASVRGAAVADTAAAAAATAGGATPTAAQVDTGIATAVAPIVTSVNALLASLRSAGVISA